MIEGLPVAIVAALARNGVIGRAHALPWHIPTDLRRFRDLTLGKPLLMGRKTFAAIGRVLPGRTTIVLSRGLAPPATDGVVHVSSIADALAAAARSARQTGAGEIMIAGGAQIFAALLGAADRLYLTHVDLDVDGDAHFPTFDIAEWQDIACATPMRANDDDAAVTFVDLRRRVANTPL